MSKPIKTIDEAISDLVAARTEANRVHAKRSKAHDKWRALETVARAADERLDRARRVLIDLTEEHAK